MDINKIVSLVLDNKFTTKQLWYPHGTINYREELKPLIEPEKELKAVMTEFVIYEFLNTTKQLCKFISTVYNTFNEAIRLYNGHTGHSNDDIFFIYKGGNILRFVSHQVFYMLPGQVKEKLVEYYRDSFKKSDADFSIYINPKLDNFDKIFEDITNLAYLLQNHLRNIFIENNTEYFNYYNLTEDAKMELLKKYLDKLNATDVIKEQRIAGSYISLGLPSIQYLEKNESPDLKKYIPKFDFEIIFTKKANILISTDPNDADKLSTTVRHSLKPIHLEQFSEDSLDDLSNKQLQIYGNISQSEFIVSVNRTTTFMVPGGLISFNLVRSKVSFNAERIINNEKILEKIDGELIDVSITNRGDYVVQHFFDNRKEYIAEYKLEEDECIVPFKAYSIEYLIHDLENILFLQNAYPWDDSKYLKRLKRLLFMYYLSLFTSSIFTSNYERVLYLGTLKQYILLPAQDYPKIGRETIINNINLFNTTFSKYQNTIKIKNLVDKIKKMVLDDGLDIEKFQIFIKNIIENINILYSSLNEFNDYQRTSGKIDEDKIYEGQLGGKNYYKYIKYKNKYKQLKYINMNK